MAQPKTTRPLKGTAAHRPTQDEVAQALKQAARQAHKQLAAQGLRLPTQTWAGTPVRDPAV